jgi:hypothetical protein
VRFEEALAAIRNVEIWKPSRIRRACWDRGVALAIGAAHPVYYGDGDNQPIEVLALFGAVANVSGIDIMADDWETVR